MRKIKWGVIGTAGIARGCTIPGMKLADNCELYAIAGRSIDKAEQYRAQFGFERAYGSYEALLQDPAVEAVYIPLPNTLHYEWTIRALKAGKHVLCEKPLAPTEAMAQEMFDAAEANGVYLMEAFACLHSPIIDAIKAEIDGGTIGDVRYIENAFLTSDYDVSNIRMRRETLGGGLYDLGCYCVSQIMWLFGEPEGAKAVAQFSENDVDRLATGILTYPNGLSAAFTCGMVLATEQDRRIDRLQIHGTKGCIVSDVQYNQAGRLSYRVVTDDQVITKYVDAPQNYSLEVAQLGRCIAEGEKPRVSRDFSIALARTMDRLLDGMGYPGERG